MRYHIFGSILWKDLPVFTLNKILIFSTIILLFLTAFLSFNNAEKTLLNKVILIAVSAHVIMSILVLKPYYLKSFYIQDSFTFSGNISLLFGTLAAIFFVFKDKLKFPANKLQFFLLLFVAIHLAAMGWKGWIQPQNWYGHLPPITLISFSLVVILLLKKKRNS